jgi:hypothetical protein
VTPRTAGVAAKVVGVTWLVVAMFVGITLRYQVPNPVELLEDVAARPVPWMIANVALIALPLAVALAAPLLVGLAGSETVGAALVTALAALGSGGLALSGVAHGVFSAHLAARVRDGTPAEDLATPAAVVHAFGDTGWFIGVGALMAITAIVTWSGRHRLRRWIVAVGLGSLVANALQFAWFADHVFGVFAGPGTVLQAVWLVAVGSEWVEVPEGTPTPHPDNPPRPATDRPL